MQPQSGRNSGNGPGRSFEAFGTINTIQLAQPASPQLLHEAVQLCLGYHYRFNRFCASSELSRLNASAGGFFACSEDMLRILEIAQALYFESGGAYNVCIAPLSKLWHFSSQEACGFNVPGTAELEAAGRNCMFSKVRLEAGGMLLPEGAGIDLGSIAKGYAADRLAEFLREQGVESGFLNFGGSILVLGPKPDGSPWRFGLQQAYRPRGQKHWAVLESAGGAFATSGSYERGATVAGRRLHHVIDPRTSYPVDSGLQEVTVFAGSATMADALSTCLFVLGVEEGLRLAQDLDVLALFRSEEGKVAASPGFPASLL